MNLFRFLLLLLSIASFNSYASNVNPYRHDQMCISAYLEKPIRTGDITFYLKNQPIGNISIFGASTDVITIQDDGHFKDQKDFEERKAFLSAENVGKRLDVVNFTYQTC